jgi:hypothetical protein
MMRFPPLSRRRLLALPLAATLAPRIAAGQAPVAWSLPIRDPGNVPGNGFTIRCAYAAENLERYPGWWHTGENWHRDGDVDSAGAEVLAVSAGEVVYADFDYPGRVVIVQHGPALYSVYGHLDYALDVAAGQQVTTGQVVGRVLAGSGWASENHLHFEIRTFFIADAINGTAPQHGVHCGYQCPPGPGYWPQDAEHPSALGWRNPMHQLHRRLAELAPLEAIVTRGADGAVVAARMSPEAGSAGDEVTLRAGDRYRLLEIEAGDPVSLETSALGYELWYRIEVEAGADRWVEAWVADDAWVGSDGRPSAVRPLLVPAS